MLLHFRDAPAREVLAQADQAHAAVGIVLRLPEQVAGDQRRIGAIVGDRQDLRGPGQQVEAAPAEQLPLGLGDILVARAAQDIDRRHLTHAEGHHGECLHPAEREDAVRPGFGHGVDRGRVPALAPDRRRARDHGLHAGHLGGDDAHLRRPEHRVAPARNVAAHGVDRDVLVAQPHARPEFHLQREKRLQLLLREPPHVALAELRVADRLRRELRDRLFALRASQFKTGRIPVIKFAAVPPHGVHAVLFEIQQHLRDQGRRLRILLE